MKKIFPLIALSTTLILTIITSCNKGDEPTPQIIDSIKSVLPKQIIWNESGVPIEIISLKYDTLNHKIELYEDDTTNTNPYDKLVISYSYNNDGYLINCMINSRNLNTAFDNATINLSRGADNEINYIAYNDIANSEKDTSFYTYQSDGGNISITSDAFWGAYNEGKTVYKYDKNYNLLEYQGDDVSATFSYNSNNSLNKMHNTNDLLSANTTEFSYTSGISDDKEDLLFRVLMGKDYYLWDLKTLYPFQFDLDPDYDNYMISGTNPFHLTHMKDTHMPDGEPTGIEDASMSYEFNDQKLLSKVTFITEAVGQFPAYTETMKIKY